MKTNHFILYVTIYFYCSIVSAQDTIPETKFTLSGYISALQNATFDSIQGNWVSGNIIHNRLNVKWYPASTLSGALEVRNRLAFGENIKLNPNAASDYQKDYGFLNLNTNVFHGKSYLLNTAVDRFWLAYEKNKWKITLGRQRINWSQTWVWNPNDILNTYSFFDFDYAERPGSDALRVQYNNSEVSITEMALKLNSQKQITGAAYYKFNKWNYDFQLLGGVLNQTDYVAGAGWSGAIKSLAFRGEMSYFRPKNHFADTTGLFLASVAFDYTLGNSLSFMTEFLYCSDVSSSLQSFQTYYSAPLSVKNLSFVKYNVLVQATYPITPLLSGTLAVMYFPSIRGYYLGPSLSYLASDNIEFSVFVQSFRATVKNELASQQKLRYNLLFIRAKLSF